MNTTNYEQKYLKYKVKYLQLKERISQLKGGATLAELQNQLAIINSEISSKQAVINAEANKHKKAVLQKELEKSLNRKRQVEGEIRKEQEKEDRIRQIRKREAEEQRKNQQLLKTARPVREEPLISFTRGRSDSTSSTDSSSSNSSSSTGSNISTIGFVPPSNDINYMQQREREALAEIDEREVRESFKIKIISSTFRKAIRTTFENIPEMFVTEMYNFLRQNAASDKPELEKIGRNIYGKFTIHSDVYEKGKKYLLDNNIVAENKIIYIDNRKQKHENKDNTTAFESGTKNKDDPTKNP